MKVGHRHYMARDGRECASVVPYIRLSGRWLAGLGFAVGQTIEVEVRGGEVVLRLADGRGLSAQQQPSVTNEPTPRSTAANWP